MISQQVLDDLVVRIVGAVQPRRILLFGSAAQGEMGPLDVLIAVADGTHRRAASGCIYQSLRRFGSAVDVEQDLADHGGRPEALREGREFSHAA